MVFINRLLLCGCLLAGISFSANAQTTLLGNVATNTTTPLVSGDCFYVSQGTSGSTGTDTKLCPGSAPAFAAALSALAIANNLSDLGSPSTARTNLGLTGTAPQAAYFSSTNTITGDTNVSYQSGYSLFNYSGSTLPAPLTSTILQLGAAGSARIELDAFGTSVFPNFTGRMARGTPTSPTATQSGDALASFHGFGYGATGYSAASRGAFIVTAAENWTDSAQGTTLNFSATAPGTLTTSPVATLSTSTASFPNGATLGNITGSTQCLQVNSSGVISGTGAVCGGSGSTFATLGGGTNTAAAMVVGSGATLGATGSGTITATAMPAAGLTGTINAAQLPAFTGDVTSPSGSSVNTLATVNSNVGSFTNANITVNGKGLITAAANGSGGGGLSGMTAGQVPIAATASTVTSSLPTSGTSGVTEIQTATSATKTAGHQLVYDANGNAVDGGAPGSGGTVTSITCAGGNTCSPTTITTTGSVTGPSGANPTGTIGTSAVNGSATTFMRSDAAPAIPQCSSSTFGACKVDGSTITASGGVISAVGGGGTPNFFTSAAAVAGTNTYTVTATPAHSVNTAGDTYCGPFTNSNTGAGTLAVGSASALAMHVQTPAGPTLVLGGGEVLGSGVQQCWQVNAAANAWVLLSAGGGVLLNPGNITVSPAQWANGTLFVYTTGTPTLTFPAVTTLPTGGTVLVFATVPVSLVPNSADAINNLAINTPFPLAQGIATPIVTSGADGAGALTVAGGPVIPVPVSWIAGQNLTSCASPPCAIPIVSYSHSVILAGINCRVELAVGGTATLDVWYAASGTALGSGTKLTTTACNANGTAFTVQNALAPQVVIPASSTVGLVATGAGWASSLGSGVVNISVQGQ